MDIYHNSERLKHFSSYLRSHQTLRDSHLNLVASENALSPLVRNALSNDLAGRYSSEFYGGSKITRTIIEYVNELAKELFQCDFASVAPISGNMCDLAAVNSLTSVGDTVALVSMSNGGYPFQIEAFDRKVAYLPFDEEKWNLKYTELEQFYEIHTPKLTILGASAFIYPYSIPKVIKHIKLDKQHIVYDGSHVLGLIAGRRFQNPLGEKIPVLFGSTHKSFPGPQGGIILGNDQEIFDLMCHQFSIQTSEHPFGKHHGTILVDNVHSNRIAALGFSLLEMLEFGQAYADQVIKNTKSLGHALQKHGFPVVNNNMFGISQSHQILMPMDTNGGLKFKEKLENAGIFTDAFVRIGTSEITRRGFKEAEMKVIAELISLAINEEKEAHVIKKEVLDFCSNFTELEFCFSEYKDLI
ncbi:MAG: hypothetical protein ACFFCZ_13610 [Promethearchaeota archaeon]